MPCHVDPPELSTDDYHKILLLEAIKLLPQLKIFPPYSPFNPDVTYPMPLYEYVLSASTEIERLSRACKYLDDKQMRSIDGPDGYMGLRSWYCSHLLKEFNGNKKNSAEQEDAKEEAKRLGAIIEPHDGAKFYRIRY